jgi:hypothetical protein
MSSMSSIYNNFDGPDPDDYNFTHEYPPYLLSQRLNWQRAARLQSEPFEDPALEAMTGHRFLVDLNTPDRTRLDPDVAPALTWLKQGHSFPGVFLDEGYTCNNCPGCGMSIPYDMTRCPRCERPTGWPERDPGDEI